VKEVKEVKEQDSKRVPLPFKGRVRVGMGSSEAQERKGEI